ncbi:MAG: carboxypeptidase-like regulatory domain-containing protein [Planctomycetes bacterium]|nr:carboxypeptidase-like regulatory domain-containing protein [Planctomycetota bacterium]
MRSATVVFVFVIAAVVAGWFFVRSKSDGPTGAASPTAALPTKPVASERPASLAGPDAAAPDERAAVSAPTATAKAPTASAKSGNNAHVGVRGRVVDGDGKAIGGARVLAAPGREFAQWPVDAVNGFAFQGEKPWSATTDAEGHFTLTGVRPGAVRLAVRATGFAHLDKNDVPIPSATDHDLGDLSLTVGVRLAGRIVDSLGRGVAGAQVLRTGAQDDPFGFSMGRPWAVPLATADASGRFVADGLAAGPYRLLTISDTHPDQVTKGATSRPGQSVEGLEIALADGLDISGRVVAFPADVAGKLVVQAWPEGAQSEGDGTEAEAKDDAPHYELRSATVAADGTFTLRGARRGTRYSLSATRAEGENGWWGDSLTTRVTVDAGARGVELAYQPEGALVFQVVDHATKKALEDFDVSAGAQWPMPLTDETGRPRRHHPEGKVRFGRLRPSGDQLVTLRIEAVGYEVYEREDLALGEGQELDLGLIELAPAPVLTVRVVDSVTQQPVAGARVDLAAEEPDNGERRFSMRISNDGGDEGDQVEYGDGKTGRTDAAGVARLGSITSKRCRLRVKQDDFAPYASELFELSSTESAERVVSMTRGGAVHVKLVGADGKPMPGARVEHRAGDEAPSDLPIGPGAGGGVVTDAQGVAHFAHLAPGSHGFRPQSAGNGAAFGNGMQMVFVGGPEEEGDPWTDVAVSEGSDSEVTVVAPQLSKLHGRITEAGTALVGATVKLEKKTADDQARMPFGPQGPTATTEADGRYTLEGVREGEYTVVVTHSGRVMPSEFALRVDSVDQRFDADLPLTIVQGRILDAQKKPVVNAEVWPERAREASTGRRQTAFRAVMITNNGSSSVASFGDAMGDPHARTDAEGRFELRGVTPDVDLVVKSSATGFQEAESERLRVAAGQTKSGVELALATAGAIDVTVAGGDAADENFYLVKALWTGDGQVPEKNEMTDAKGKLRLTGLKPGPWKISARRIDGPSNGERPTPVDQDVVVPDGQTKAITLQMP